MPRLKKTLKLPEKKVKDQKKTDRGLTIPVYNIDGKVKGDLELPKEIFQTGGKPQLLAQYVRVYLANQRQGTASTKTRAEVVGSTRKIYRQKGTGRARHGDIKAPVFVGGGIVGGPKPRDFSLKLNKRQKNKALLYALTLKHKEKEIIALSKDFLTIEPKTKRINEFLKLLDLTDKKILLLHTILKSNNLVLASRNLQNISAFDINSIDPYTVLKNQKILILENAVELLSKLKIQNEN